MAAGTGVTKAKGRANYSITSVKATVCKVDYGICAWIGCNFRKPVSAPTGLWRILRRV